MWQERISGARIARAACLFAVTAGVGAGSGPAAALSKLGAAEPPHALAVETRLFYVNQPGSVDSTPDGTFSGTRAWRGEILNLNGPAAPTIAGTHIQVDTASPTWAWSGTPPTFPIDEATGDVPANSRVQMTRIDNGPADAHAWVDNTPVSTGYDSGRTQAPVVIPDGGAVQQDTVSVTLRNPAWNFAEIDIYTHEPNGPGVVPAAIVAASIVTPVLSNGEVLSPKPGPQPDRFEWAIDKAVPGVTYTVSYEVNVGRGGSFKPFVTVRGGTSTTEPAVTGTAMSIGDPELGGTFTFTSTDAATEWSGAISDVISTNYELVTTPALRASTAVRRGASATFPASVDSVTHGPLIGDFDFTAIFANGGTSEIPNPSITASGSPLAFAPPQTFPSRVEAPSLAPRTLLRHGLLAPPSAQVPGALIEAGFDISRSLSTTTIPAGGGFETVTTTVTVRDPALLGQSLGVVSETDAGIGAEIVLGSVLLPALSHGEALQFDSTATSAQVSLSNVALDVPYPVTYTVRVPNTGAAPMSYKPFVTAESLAGRTLPPVVGSSTAEIADDVLGGTWTFVAGAPVDWQLSLLDETAVNLGFEAVSTAPVSRFAVRVFGPATAGSPARFTVTALDASNNRVPSFAGPVDLTDLGGGVFGSLTWSNGVGTGTLTVDHAVRSDRIQVRDTTTGNTGATGQSGPFQVYGPFVAFKLAVTPTSAAVATPLAITAWAVDDVGHVIPTYTGTGATLTDLLGSAGVGLPVLTWVKGAGKGTATFSAPVRADKIVVTDGAVTTTSGAFTRYGGLTRFGLSVTPRSAPVGTTVTVRVSALDVNGSLVKDYPGGATLSDTQGAVDWPAATFVNGIAIVTFAFGSPVTGDRITVTDGPVSTTSGPISAL